MIHALNTGKRLITFDDATGQLVIPAIDDGTVALLADEAAALLTWLHDKHRDALYRLARGIAPDNERPLCPWCREPGEYTVRQHQTEVTLEYNTYKCTNGHLFDVRGEQ